MLPGIYENFDIDTYHASGGITNSGISLMRDCPARYYYEYHVKPTLLTEDEKKTLRDKFKMGRYVHTLLLEPEKFDKLYYVMTESVKLNTTVGKNIYNAALEIAGNREVIRFEDFVTVKGMVDSARKHSLWGKLSNPKIENSLFWNDGLFNTPLRARPDVYDDKIIIDIKTTSSIKDFARSIYNFGYHRQGAMQIDGIKKLTGKDRIFGIFAIENKEPYLTATFELHYDDICQGRREYLETATQYSECLAANEWPGYPEDFQEIRLPAYTRTTEDEI
jgi:hypothetical protein